MLRKTQSAIWVFVVLGMSGCSMLFPSESLYAGGFAWIGEDLYLYAPMCEGEELTGIDIYDVKSNDKDPNNPIKVDLWIVRDPLVPVISNGWVTIGNDSAFNVVLEGSTHPSLWPEIVGILVTHQDAEEEFRSELTLDKGSDLPRYSAGSDPLTIDYLFENPNGRSGPGLYSPEEMRDQMGCAKQYF